MDENEIKYRGLQAILVIGVATIAAAFIQNVLYTLKYDDAAIGVATTMSFGSFVIGAAFDRWFLT